MFIECYERRKNILLPAGKQICIEWLRGKHFYHKDMNIFKYLQEILVRNTRPHWQI